MDVATDLPKVKLKNAKPAPKEPVEKKAEAKVKKPVAKATKKEVAPAKPASKTVKASPKKDAKPAAKAKAPKAETKKTAAKGKQATMSVEAISNYITKAVASGKVDDKGAVDYASGKSVVDGLVVKAAKILLKTYSDKAVSAIQHGDAEVAKAAKEILAKNAASIRSAAAIKHAKKFAGPILKAYKAAESGKLSAADYRAVAFAV